MNNEELQKLAMSKEEFDENEMVEQIVEEEPQDNTQQIKEETPKTTNPPILNVEPPKFIPLCLFCRKELLPNAHGRKRLYCDKKCCTKYWVANNKEKWAKSVRIASREYQRRKQKKIVEERLRLKNLELSEMSKDNSLDDNITYHQTE